MWKWLVAAAVLGAFLVSFVGSILHPGPQFACAERLPLPLDQPLICRSVTAPE